MDARRTLPLVRGLALVGLTASAILVADATRPGRGLCPLESACEAARSSALGSVLGVPTSVVGIAAFGSLLLLTFLDRAWVRRTLVFAGAFAVLAGVGLLAFQAIALRTFCPFCLVADVSAIGAGTVAWAASRGAPTSAATRTGPIALALWGGAAVLVVALPLTALRPSARPAWTALASPAVARDAGGGGGGIVDAAPGIAVVEYLNPYCPHCRAVHARLASAIASVGLPVRRERLYVWARGAPPYWARACVCAQEQGRERELFAALLSAKDEGEETVREAARRVGLDVARLDACGAGRGAGERLDRVRELVLAAGIEGMPTIDIGRRRLAGEASERELEDALRAAAADRVEGARR